MTALAPQSAIMQPVEDDETEIRTARSSQSRKPLKAYLNQKTQVVKEPTTPKIGLPRY